MKKKLFSAFFATSLGLLLFSPFLFPDSFIYEKIPLDKGVYKKWFDIYGGFYCLVLFGSSTLCFVMLGEKIFDWLKKD